ncbi:MAG: Zinc finger UBP-type protein [Candidatus Amesbacteria bacterium GW2011_GWA1_47_16]|uniref:Zinc finger UBP-type protein n=1 Tax=Candidatus Amesbacteria bacterium GW2011_GWA1_47_16 TaxID=1618353 RepID=A0A0G1V252_9BACT|nr:MAG: Zinc finger UBP-type protein [Candidatus Amesbacteria bacterium GW2011_GWA1_47_16]
MPAAVCTHLDQIKQVTPSAEGCEDCLKNRGQLGPLATLSYMRSCRLLRQFKKQARDKAFQGYGAPGYAFIRNRRILDVVLRGRNIAIIRV